MIQLAVYLSRRKTRIFQVLDSQVVRDITIAIGVNPNSGNLDKLRYGKICILADADSDGCHISTLLYTLFMKHFYPLVENGYLYVAMPPLYRINVDKKSILYLKMRMEKKRL